MQWNSTQLAKTPTVWEANFNAALVKWIYIPIITED